MRKTKIVATIGPASESEEILKEMVDSGVNIARQNFSHGTHEQHSRILKRLRSLPEEIGVMMDTQGPEIRLGYVSDDTVLEQGRQVSLVGAEKEGTEKELPVDHPDFFKYVEEGDTVLIDDGQIELKVEEMSDERARCSVVYGGRVLSKKSVNVPGRDTGLTTPTEKDIKDIEFAVKKGFDFVSVSFVKTAEDVKNIKELLDDYDSDMQVISKIEHMRAVENLDEILEVTDGVMIARGDLGVEVPASEVPLIQKRIIEKCNRMETPVITATQMLKSMTESPRATRAEVSDVANAVMDGSDAVMLSEETAIGKYPVKSVQFMAEVVGKMEEYVKDRVHHTTELRSDDIADIISKNVWQTSRAIDAKYIVAHTSSGYTARKIAKFRPNTDILVFTDSKTVQRQLNLVWGVKAFKTEFPEHVDEMICNSAEFLKERGLVEDEDTLILTAGVPAPVSGITNMLEIRTVSSLLEEGESIRKG